DFHVTGVQTCALPILDHYEAVRRRKDGRAIVVSVTLSAVKDALGRLSGASKVARDVTERKRFEDELRRTNQHLNNAIESYQGPFALFDKHDILLFCNSSFHGCFGSGFSGSILGESFVDIVNKNAGAGFFDVGDQSSAAWERCWLAYHRNPEGTLDLCTTDGRVLRVTHRRTVDGGTVRTARAVERRGGSEVW